MAWRPDNRILQAWKPLVDNQQLRELIIKPVLTDMGMYSVEAENLIAGTIAQESRMGEFIHQINGPALGICQMEPETHKDIMNHYVAYRPVIQESLKSVSRSNKAEDMIHDLRYAIAMCRLHYYRIPEKIPSNIKGQAEYWKEHYNTAKGKGTVEEYCFNYSRYAQ